LPLKDHAPGGIATYVRSRCMERAHRLGADREPDVLRRVAAGDSNRQVATQLSISEDTVKAHMKSISSKLGADGRTHVVAIAIKRGIIDV
jgi:DNA-binding NarL/FixJ family response regulator